VTAIERLSSELEVVTGPRLAKPIRA